MLGFDLISVASHNSLFVRFAGLWVQYWITMGSTLQLLLMGGGNVDLLSMANRHWQYWMGYWFW